VVVDRVSRLLLLVLLLAFAGWRLIRYLRLAMARRSVGLASGAGMLVQSDAAVTPPGTVPASRRAWFARLLLGAAFWVLANLLIALLLLRLPLLRDLPPIVLLVAAVFANFYVIPQARRWAARWGNP
jgi:hypothetical protein